MRTSLLIIVCTLSGCDVMRAGVYLTTPLVAPLDPRCIEMTIRARDDVARMETTTSRPLLGRGASSESFLVLARDDGYTHLRQVHHPDGSTRLQTGRTWMNRMPSVGERDRTVQLMNSVVDGVIRECWGSPEPGASKRECQVYEPAHRRWEACPSGVPAGAQLGPAP